MEFCTANILYEIWQIHCTLKKTLLRRPPTLYIDCPDANEPPHTTHNLEKSTKINSDLPEFTTQLILNYCQISDILSGANIL